MLFNFSICFLPISTLRKNESSFVVNLIIHCMMFRLECRTGFCQATQTESSEFPVKNMLYRLYSRTEEYKDILVLVISSNY